MNRVNAQKLRKDLHNQLPLIGPRIRLKACEKLIRDSSANAVCGLIEALDLKDTRVRTMAESALRSLANREAQEEFFQHVQKNPLGRSAQIYCQSHKTRMRELQAEHVDFLLKALKHFDAGTRMISEETLLSLTDASAIQKLYDAAWNNPEGLAATLYLKIGERLSAQDPAASIPMLLNVMKLYEQEISSRAVSIMSSIDNRAAIDILFKMAIEDPWGPAAKICLEPTKSFIESSTPSCFSGPTTKILKSRGSPVMTSNASFINKPAAKVCLQTKKRPSSHELYCLFLFVTRQLDEYFKEDDDFQYLHDAYEHAADKVKEHVMDVVRSGDRRCLAFFGNRRKTLHECTDDEIQVAINSALEHKDWPRLFHAFLDLPLKHSFPILDHLRLSSWEPPEEEMKGLLRQALAESKEISLPKKRQDFSSSLFESWLSTESRPSGTEPELVEKLKNCSPVDGVCLVGALSILPSLSPSTVKFISQHEHWLVRMAGFTTGITAITFNKASNNADPNFWIREVTYDEGILEFWPDTATPDDLARLQAMPPEAWNGQLGTFRKLLQMLIAQRMNHPGEIVPVEFEAGEFAGEFIDAD
jgi:hypothetical protein